MLDIYENQDAASHIVYGENDEVYIYNILPNASTDTYVKGVKKDDKIVIELPQTVFWSEEAEDGYNLSMLSLTDLPAEEGEEPEQTYVATDDTELVFTVAEDGSMVAEGLSEEKIIGLSLCSDGSWGYYGAWELSITPFDKSVVELPSDYEVSENFWSYICPELGYGWNVSWAQGYEDVYFQGLSPDMPEAWVKATVEYDDTEAILSIAQDQYVGDYYGYRIFTKAAKIEVDEDGYAIYELMPEDYQYQLVWDFDDNTLTPKDADVVLLLNASMTEVYYLNELYDFVLQHQTSYDGTPQNPFDLEFGDYLADYGYAVFRFDVPSLSTDGDLLLTDNLSYVVYVDGEEWTFDVEDYPDLEESMVEIPWSFDSYDIMKYNGATHVIYFYVEGMSTLGVQSIYKYEGEETRSEIVTLDLEDPDSVAGIDADKKVASVKYYDVAGREVSKPAGGIFIKRVTFEDGTVSTSKKAIR